MDIFILYTRIQIFCPKLKFLAKVSAYKIGALIMLFALIMNLPVDLSRQVVNTSFKIDSNVTTVLYTYGKLIMFLCVVYSEVIIIISNHFKIKLFKISRSIHLHQKQDFFLVNCRC